MIFRLFFFIGLVVVQSCVGQNTQTEYSPYGKWCVKGSGYFSGTGYFEGGIGYSRIRYREMFGGKDNIASTTFVGSYVRSVYGQDSFYGYSLGVELSDFVVNFKLSGQYLMNNENQTAMYLRPSFGLGVLEYVQLNLAGYIPLNGRSISVPGFQVGLSGALFVGGRDRN